MVYLVVALVCIVAIVGPSLWVQFVLNKYSRPAERYHGTGRELAQHLLESEGVTNVSVEATPGGDHYDPIAKCVRLTPRVYEGRSLTAIAIAAHEVGHAVQDHTGYSPLRLRTTLARLLGPMEKLGAGMLFIAPLVGVVTRAPAPTLLTVFAGLLVLGSGVVIHAVTLPMEVDASFRRALPILRKHNILIRGDEPHARRILLAAAATYVAAALASLFNIARWWAVLRR